MSKKILIVDDEPHILWMVSNRLKASGYQIIGASCGEEGLQKAEAEQPDLILLDQVMPGMPGDEVLALLKKKSSTQHIPVIMFTADVKKVRIGEYQQLGAAECIFKPFTPNELLEKAKKALGEETGAPQAGRA